jgi:hypothetical protein
VYDRPSPSGEDDGREERSPSVNLIVLAVVLAFTILAYWAFNALEHSRRFQRCLDSGQRNCVNAVAP